MKRQGRGSIHQKTGGSSISSQQNALSTDPNTRLVCKWSSQQLEYWLISAGLTALVPLMNDEAKSHDLSPEVSIFAKHATAPNLLRLAWLPQNKISALIGLSADDDLRKIFVYEDFSREFMVVQSMLISPTDLLNQFQERIHKPVPLIPLHFEDGSVDTARGTDSRSLEAVAIIEYLKEWLSFDGYYEMASDPVLLRAFNTFCDLHVSPVNSSDAKLLKADAKARIKQRQRKEKEKDKKTYYTSAAPKPHDVGKSKHLSLMDIHPEELARQLTLMEEDIFIQIRPREFLKQAWNKGNHEVNAPFVTRLTRNFNKLINWITTEVLKHSDAATRADTISHFIKTAKHLEALKNYNGVMQVLSSLHSSAISRLKQSWALIKPGTKDQFDHLTHLMSNLGNFRTFRDTYAALEPHEPCIPFIAVFLTDCTYLDDTMNDKDDSGRYNWEKLSTMAIKIREIRRFHMDRYDLIPVSSIQQFISSAESWNDNKTLYAISQLAEDGSGKAEGNSDSGGTVKKGVDNRKQYSKFNRVTVANMNLKSMYLHTDTSAEQNSLSQRDWKVLLTGATLRTYKDGEVILDIGTTNDRLFRIKAGMVKVHKQSIDTPPVATMGKEEMFGEISMLLRGEDGTTTAAIVASGVVEIWEISIDFVLRMCEGDHLLSEKLHRIIAVKLASRLKSLNTAKRQRPAGGMGRSSSKLIDRRSAQLSSANGPSPSASPLNSMADSSASPAPGTEESDKPSKIKVLRSLAPSSSLSSVPEDDTTTDSVSAATMSAPPSRRNSSKRIRRRSQQLSESQDVEEEDPSSSPANASPLRGGVRIMKTPKISRMSELSEAENPSATSTSTTTQAEKKDDDSPTSNSQHLGTERELSPKLSPGGTRHRKASSGESQLKPPAPVEGSTSVVNKSPERAHPTPSPERRTTPKRALSRSSSTANVLPSAVISSEPVTTEPAAAPAPAQVETPQKEPAARAASPGKSLASWKGRVSAALLPRRSTSDGGHKEKDKLEKEKDKEGSTSNEKKNARPQTPDGDPQDVMFRKRFKLKENVILLRTYECAHKGAVVSHGTFYISEKYWCFGSKVFGLKTSEVVRVETITDLDHNGKYLVIKYGTGSSKSLKLLGFENLEDTHSLLKSFWEKFTQKAKDATPSSAPGATGIPMTRRMSTRAINRSALMDAIAASSSGTGASSSSSLNTSATASSAPSGTGVLANSHAQTDDLEEDFEEDMASKFELTPQDWAKILKGANLVAFQKGDYIIKEGDQFQRVFQLLRGSACIQKEVNDVMTVLGRLKAEDGVFGEISFLEGGCATASIVADEDDTAVYIIEGYFLNVFFERNPGVGGRFYHFLAQLLSKRIKAREASQAAAAAASSAASEITFSESASSDALAVATQNLNALSSSPSAPLAPVPLSAASVSPRKKSPRSAELLPTSNSSPTISRDSPAAELSSSDLYSTPVQTASDSSSGGGNTGTTPPVPSLLSDDAVLTPSNSSHQLSPSSSTSTISVQRSPREGRSPREKSPRAALTSSTPTAGANQKSPREISLSFAGILASAPGSPNASTSPRGETSPRSPTRSVILPKDHISRQQSRPLSSCSFDQLPTRSNQRISLPSASSSSSSLTIDSGEKSPRSPRTSPRGSSPPKSPRSILSRSAASGHSVEFQEEDEVVQLPGNTLLMSGTESPRPAPMIAVTVSKRKKRSRSEVATVIGEIRSPLATPNSSSTPSLAE